MRFSYKIVLTTMAIFTAISLGINHRPASADQSNDESQMNHEQMMNSQEHQMSMQQCADNPDAEMNHEQMMNSDGEQMPMPDDSPTSNE